MFQHTYIRHTVLGIPLLFALAACGQEDPATQVAATSTPSTINAFPTTETLAMPPETLSPLPMGCTRIESANENLAGWSGWKGIDQDRVVWRQIDREASSVRPVLRERTLSTGAERILLVGTCGEEIAGPAVFGDTVVFERSALARDPLLRSIYFLDPRTATPRRLGRGPFAAAEAAAGDHGEIHLFAGRDENGHFTTGIEWSPLAGGPAERIAEVNGGQSRMAFDGRRYVAYQSDNQLFVVDLESKNPKPRRLSDQKLDILWMAFGSREGDLVTGTVIPGVTQDASLDAWNVITGKRTVLVDDEYDQGIPDAHGDLVVYLDSSPSGRSWTESYLSEVKILDRRTRSIRTLAPLDRNFNPGIWSKWVAFNNAGRWGDTIVLCDLERGSFLDEAGNLVSDATQSTPSF